MEPLAYLSKILEFRPPEAGHPLCGYPAQPAGFVHVLARTSKFRYKMLKS